MGWGLGGRRRRVPGTRVSPADPKAARDSPGVLNIDDLRQMHFFSVNECFVLLSKGRLRNMEQNAKHGFSIVDFFMHATVLY